MLVISATVAAALCYKAQTFPTDIGGSSGEEIYTQYISI